MQIGVAHAAGLDPDQHLVGARIGHVHRHHLDGRTTCSRDDAGNLVRNACALVRSTVT